MICPTCRHNEASCACQQLVRAVNSEPAPERLSVLAWASLGIGSALVLAMLLWQGFAAKGAPDPTQTGLTPASMMLSSGVLVFREGLEAILVLAAVTAGVVRNRLDYWRSIVFGVIAALAATLATWFIVVALLSSINAPALDLQAATGLLAVVVLLVVMNWFFHKIYWTGWISQHSKRRKHILDSDQATPRRIAFGLALLGFTAIYREGFEVVLFLQNLRLRNGTDSVLPGAGIGFVLTVIVGAITFYAHRRLPYKRMLIISGALLALVLLVMVGESAQELQLAGWLPTHDVHWPIPPWAGMWFAVFPNVEGLVSQALAALVVITSYAWIRMSVPRTARNQNGPRQRANVVTDSSKGDRKDDNTIRKLI